MTDIPETKTVTCAVCGNTADTRRTFNIWPDEIDDPVTKSQARFIADLLGQGEAHMECREEFLDVIIPSEPVGYPQGWLIASITVYDAQFPEGEVIVDIIDELGEDVLLRWTHLPPGNESILNIYDYNSVINHAKEQLEDESAEELIVRFQCGC